MLLGLIMTRDANLNVLMMGFLIDNFFGISPSQELNVALKDDMLSMFSGNKLDRTAQLYFGKFNDLKASVTELMIVQACHDGQSVTSMSSAFNVSVQYIYRALKKHGCKPNKSKRVRNWLAFYHKLVENELIRLMHEDGMSAMEIARQVNLNEKTIKKYLRLEINGY